MCRIEAVQTEAARAIADMAEMRSLAAPLRPPPCRLKCAMTTAPVMQVDFRFEVVVRAGS